MSESGYKPDFSDVDTRAKALALVAEGQLERVHLFPLDLGGEDVDANVVYLPIGFGDIKKQLDGTLMRLVEEGSISKLVVEPTYKGRSVVPSKILMRATHPERPGSFEPTLEVW